VLAFGVLGWLYLDLLPGRLGLGDGEHLDISMWKIALNVEHLPARQGDRPGLRPHRDARLHRGRQ
jgi:hypothetical protein